LAMVKRHIGKLKHAPPEHHTPMTPRTPPFVIAVRSRPLIRV